MITLTLPDGKKIEAPKGATVYEIIGTIGKGLQKAALAASLDEVQVDLSYKVEKDAALKVITWDSPEGPHVFLHSASHLMAQALRRLYGNVQLAIGPSIENGFYYDIDTEKTISEDDFAAIEGEMQKIVDEDLPITRQELSRSEAIALFEKDGEQYKVEMLNDMDNDMVSLYHQGDFYDLCRGPHVPSTGYLKAFKIMSVAGAYWRGDEKRPMLQRIYGTAFPDAKKLKQYLNMLEEAKKRDHRKLGRELDLFSTHEDVGAGLIYWHPRGARMRSILEEWWRQEHYRGGYELLYTPHVGRSTLWETSGHLDFYSEGMYSPMEIDGSDYYIKPMNCPFHIKVYQTKMRSYRELPLRWAELGTVYRYEKSGVLHGLLRVRGFTQDDAHIICTPSQIEDEIREVLRFAMNIWHILGFTDIKAYLSTRPEKSVGDDSLWQQATESLQSALDLEKMDAELDEGGGAFYGPKIDLKIRDAIGREWQVSTIQFDFNLPERFDMTYIGEDGQKHRPYMVHRALFGSLERFFGILIEHYAGKFPVWFAPVQAMLINVSDDQLDYVKKRAVQLKGQGIRVEHDYRNESMGYRIREAIGQKIPYIAVVGEKEMADDAVSVRRHGEKESRTMSQDEFIALIHDDVLNKR